VSSEEEGNLIPNDASLHQVHLFPSAEMKRIIESSFSLTFRKSPGRRERRKWENTKNDGCLREKETRGKAPYNGSATAGGKGSASEGRELVIVNKVAGEEGRQGWEGKKVNADASLIK